MSTQIVQEIQAPAAPALGWRQGDNRWTWLATTDDYCLVVQQQLHDGLYCWYIRPSGSAGNIVLSGQDEPTLEAAQIAAERGLWLYTDWDRLYHLHPHCTMYTCRRGHVRCTDRVDGPCYDELNRQMFELLRRSEYHEFTRQRFAEQYGCTWFQIMRILHLATPLS